ncbi:MAG: AbrB/MazE/SpoVT family DNA-binding domain-containing protein [Microthrixaceae bacterium]
MPRVKGQVRRSTRISSKHQITIPVAELRAAGLEVGQRLVARSDGPGRVILEREDDVIGEFAGSLTAVYAESELESLRGEWD